MAALALAGVGIFSVVTLSVTRRTREIGIRKALGASGREINVLVVGQAMGPVIVGLFLGLGGSLAGARLLEGLMFGVEPSDPRALMAGCALLLMTGAIAAYLPARRAGGVDPVHALRVD